MTYATDTSSGHVPGKSQSVPTAGFSLRESITALADPVRRSIGDDDHHLCCVPPPLQVTERDRHPCDDGFRPVSTTSGSKVVEELVQFGRVGSERQGLGHIRIVLAGMVSIADDLTHNISETVRQGPQCRISAGSKSNSPQLGDHHGSPSSRER